MSDRSPACQPSVVPPYGGSKAPLASLGTILKIPSAVTDGRVAIVEHTLAPGRLAAPLHRHSREDEVAIVLAGRLGVLLGDEVVTASANAYVWQPRHQWHTFWNAGDTELHLIALFVPGGFDRYFTQLSRMLAAPSREETSEILRVAADYGLELAPERTDEIRRRFALPLP